MLLFTKFFAAILLASLIYTTPLISRAIAGNASLIKDLILVVTVVNRIKNLLTDDPQNFVFNFIVNTNKTSASKRSLV